MGRYVSNRVFYGIAFYGEEDAPSELVQRIDDDELEPWDFIEEVMNNHPKLCWGCAGVGDYQHILYVGQKNTLLTDYDASVPFNPASLLDHQVFDDHLKEAARKLGMTEEEIENGLGWHAIADYS